MASKPNPKLRVPPPAEETGEGEMPPTAMPMQTPPAMRPPAPKPVAPKGKGPKKGKDFGFTKSK